MARRSPRREVLGKRFEGARELDRILREADETVPGFCDRHGIDRFHVQRLLAGHVKRSPPVEIVLQLQKATDGRITPEMFSEGTLRDDTPSDIPTAGDSGPDLGATDPDATGPQPIIGAPADENAKATGTGAR